MSSSSSKEYEIEIIARNPNSGVIPKYSRKMQP